VKHRIVFTERGFLRGAGFLADFTICEQSTPLLAEREKVIWHAVKFVVTTTIKLSRLSSRVELIHLIALSVPFMPLRRAALIAVLKLLGMAWKKMEASSAVPIVPQRRGFMKWKIVFDNTG
jgi:hypothetical protein